MSTATHDAFDASLYWRLNDEVSLRDEAFGALAYHHVRRRLIFLKSPRLVTLVRRLGDFDSADDALDALVEPQERATVTRALGTLSASEILRGR